MRSSLKYSCSILALAALLIGSCAKDAPVVNPVNWTIIPSPPPPPRFPLEPFPPVHDSLSGREFRYDSLVWQSWGYPYVALEIPASHLFLYRGIEVSIDSSSTWLKVPFYTVEFGIGALPFPVHNGYIYDNNYFDSVFLFAIHPNSNLLVGARASVRIKVL